jgi:hypothetical protein
MVLKVEPATKNLQTTILWPSRFVIEPSRPLKTRLFHPVVWRTILSIFKDGFFFDSGRNLFPGQPVNLV